MKTHPFFLKKVIFSFLCFFLLIASLKASYLLSHEEDYGWQHNWTIKTSPHFYKQYEKNIITVDYTYSYFGDCEYVDFKKGSLYFAAKKPRDSYTLDIPSPGYFTHFNTLVFKISINGVYLDSLEEDIKPRVHMSKVNRTIELYTQKDTDEEAKQKSRLSKVFGDIKNLNHELLCKYIIELIPPSPEHDEGPSL